ncbi:uncharacterized protein LOC123228785 [Mangifera indica]|uniref:uncharacterized protein LOC123228785 n=1 Tax=Mangifera indica TaxID=29780 RepID=UPI001CFAB02E|nr:uncharacterized protein LOC123228785 [Mangifera indica]
MAILETKVRCTNVNRVCSSIWESWEHCSNERDGSISRIWIGWNKATIRLNVIADDAQYMHCDVKLVRENTSIGLTIVYGSNNPMERKVLWSSLINKSHMMQNSPWIILGDFNAIKHPQEKVGGATWGNYYCEDLRNCMRDTELDDLRFMGHLLTWSNRSEGERRIACKLARALINDSWKDIFPNAMAHFLNPSISAHSPCMEGDQNTKFFFKSIEGRRNRNSIYGIQRKDGSFVHNMEEVKEEFVEHFKSVLNGNEHSNVDLEKLKKLVKFRIGCEEKDMLIRDISAEEEIFQRRRSKKTFLPWIITKPRVWMDMVHVFSRLHGT